jgi:hypothetical protein
METRRQEMGTIEIAGRTFSVEKIEAKHTGYILRGQRGAIYGATRSVNEPDYLFLVKLTGAARVDPLGPGVWLTDANGTLEEVAR